MNKALDDYYTTLNGEKPSSVYRMVTGLVDTIVIKDALLRSQNNYTKASRMLGISRSTLKNKLDASK